MRGDGECQSQIQAQRSHGRLCAGLRDRFDDAELMNTAPFQIQVRRAYRIPSSVHEADKGGHFAAWEQPELSSDELRAASGHCGHR
jgi:pimeloyl-ACP methyl ester carboxylesterase